MPSPVPLLTVTAYVAPLPVTPVIEVPATPEVVSEKSPASTPVTLSLNVTVKWTAAAFVGGRRRAPRGDGRRGSVDRIDLAAGVSTAEWRAGRVPDRAVIDDVEPDRSVARPGRDRDGVGRPANADTRHSGDAGNAGRYHGKVGPVDAGDAGRERHGEVDAARVRGSAPGASHGHDRRGRCVDADAGRNAGAVQREKCVVGRCIPERAAVCGDRSGEGDAVRIGVASGDRVAERERGSAAARKVARVDGAAGVQRDADAGRSAGRVDDDRFAEVDREVEILPCSVCGVGRDGD